MFLTARVCIRGGRHRACGVQECAKLFPSRLFSKEFPFFMCKSVQL